VAIKEQTSKATYKVPLGTRDWLQSIANARGISIVAYIVAAVDAERGNYQYATGRLTVTQLGAGGENLGSMTHPVPHAGRRVGLAPSCLHSSETEILTLTSVSKKVKDLITSSASDRSMKRGPFLVGAALTEQFNHSTRSCDLLVTPADGDPFRVALTHAAITGGHCHRC